MIFLDTGNSSKEGYNWIYWFVKLFRSYLHLYDPYAFQFLWNTFEFTENNIWGNNVYS